MWIKIRFLQVSSVDPHHALMNLNGVAGQANHTLDVTFRGIVWKPKNYYIASINFWCPAIFIVVNQFVNKDSLTVMKTRQHRRALNFYWLHYKDDHQRR